ncbi:MAG: hypothetical protein K2H96_11695 [Muribaculaceae bacterium]|nr:hypothetical protein [Muribaculaceae bacterium]
MKNEEKNVRKEREKREGYGKVFFEHKYTRRKRDHDYTSPCTYHIILKKHEDCRDFGLVAGNPQIRYKEHGCARIDRSKLGWVIENDRALLTETCLENAKSGGVAVSAFISEGEKKIRDALIAADGRMIHIQEKPFADRFKPEKRRFEQCSEGNLLILAPMEPLDKPSRRAECLYLNWIAEEVAAGHFLI